MHQQLDGRYEILRPLGSGGFGKTYLAKDLRIPGAPYCVVKQLHSTDQKQSNRELAQDLFQREAESLAKLGHHAQIPRLLAYFRENEEFYLVEDFIDGRSLEEEIRPGQPWTDAAVIELLRSILDVLSFVHHQGVIHRDIKPSNLIRRSSDGKVVLIDFGAIKQIKQTGFSHPTGTQIGTVGYMPPEQAQGKPRPNSDIYGVGILAISALTGHPATGLPDDLQTGEIIWQHLAHVSPGLAHLLSGMVRYHFQDRYQTADEVLRTLSELTSIPAGVHPTAGSQTLPIAPAASQAPLPTSQDSSHRPRVAPWMVGIAIATLIPTLGGLAALLFNGRTPTRLPTAKTEEPCTATVVGNIRSERTAYRGGGNILRTGQGQPFAIGTQETRGGWIQIKLPGGTTAWAHLDVVANEADLKSCLQQKNVSLELIADIPAPSPRPSSGAISPPTSPATPPASTETPPEDSIDDDAVTEDDVIEAPVSEAEASTGLAEPDVSGSASDASPTDPTDSNAPDSKDVDNANPDEQSPSPDSLNDSSNADDSSSDDSTTAPTTAEQTGPRQDVQSATNSASQPGIDANES
ncbi:MAG: serine/threonine-protein kinase [Cyanobacteria bacterium P01_F01_bin.42]